MTEGWNNEPPRIRIVIWDDGTGLAVKREDDGAPQLYDIEKGHPFIKEVQKLMGMGD